jgi:amidase
MLDATHGADVGASCYAPHFTDSWLEAVARAPKRLRIAASAKPLLGDSVDTHVLEGFDATVKLLEELGHEVVEATPVIERERFTIAFLTVICAELRTDIEEAAKTAGEKMRARDFDATSFGLGLFGKAFSATELAEARRYLQAAALPILAFFEDYDVMLTPVLASPPVEIGSLLPNQAEMAFVRILSRFDAGWVLKALGLLKPLSRETFSFTPWTPIFNVTGQPAMSVPLHWTEGGLPVGMQFVGRFGDEETLFSLAGELEAARQWAEKIPPGFGA